MIGSTAPLMSSSVKKSCMSHRNRTPIDTFLPEVVGMFVSKSKGICQRNSSGLVFRLRFVLSYQRLIYRDEVRPFEGFSNC